MPNHGTEAKPRTVMVGPMALVGVVLAGRAIRRRSYASAMWAVGLFGVEAAFRPYRRRLRKGALRTDPEGNREESLRWRGT
jgi:MYXO-CTERM domain-containing protein